MIEVWLRAVFIVSLAASAGACSFDADYHRTRYQCDVDGNCPAGYACRRGYCEPVSQGTLPSDLQGCGTTNLLVSDFDDAEAGLDTSNYWYTWGDNLSFSQIEQRLQLEPADPAYSANGGYETRQLYVMRSSRVFVEVPDVPVDIDVALTLEIEADSATDAVFRLDDGTLELSYELLDRRYVLDTLAYDPETHRFWQLRETEGMLYWEVSTDGMSWKIQAATSSHTLAGPVRVKLLANLPAGSPPVFFDNLNGGVVPESERWCAAESIADDFNDSLVGTIWDPWDYNDCSFFERDGQLVFEIDALRDSGCGFETNTRYDLTGSSVAVEVPQVDETGVLQTIFTLIFPGQGDVELKHGNFGEELDKLVCRNNIPGVDATSCSEPYDAVEHRWWQFRHDDTEGKLHWETSPDGQTWTSRASYGTADFEFEEVIIMLSTYSPTQEVERESIEVAFDNLNIDVR